MSFQHELFYPHRFPFLAYLLHTRIIYNLVLLWKRKNCVIIKTCLKEWAQIAQKHKLNLINSKSEKEVKNIK